jgi:hypothetical protein
MTTTVAETRYIDNQSPYSITSPGGDVASYTVLISTTNTGVYVGPQSMGPGSSFPATVDGSHGIGGYPLVPNKEYTFTVKIMAGTQNADNSGLCVSTPNTTGAIVSYFVLEK